jgi:hypothetical protein
MENVERKKSLEKNLVEENLEEENVEMIDLFLVINDKCYEKDKRFHKYDASRDFL